MVHSQGLVPTEQSSSVSPMLEKMARAMANDDYEARIEFIRASQKTDRPISVPGPFDGLDYLLSAKQWDTLQGAEFLKDEHRRRARAALQAIRDLPLEWVLSRETLRIDDKECFAEVIDSILQGGE